ncbi:class I adenylate-forming enzyme family protein [Novosphingobium sp. JCM 18896]|uniref:class I adenylate-forming enzyme family protein n=1 Tax=Novosphingobium sp. JCM 18896 TaxID=2989731 RepID=UPI0022224560|nr:class I adenylate-forming enzyme family protein [Novosphingobium sp. JCM 18896]MCW1429028.1 acyl--CoA ligase [Novosphingobium sp. JCM 18896]
MPSELDQRLTAKTARVTASGTPFETGFLDRGGSRLPVFARAPETLTELFARSCAEHAETEFLVDGDVRLTYAETHALAQRVAAGLVTRHGVRRGDRVGLAARNSASWIVLYMGVLMAGGCVTLLNGWWAGNELAGGVALAECSLVLADRPRAERLAQAGSAAPVVVFEHGRPESGLAALLVGAIEISALPTLDADDLATIVFTSGSTGMAKAAVSDHRALVQATYSFVVQAQVIFDALAPDGAEQPPQSALVSVPLFHVAGEIALFLQSFLVGRRLIVMPKWDALEAMRLIESERITFFAGVPSMSVEIASHPARGDFDLTSCVGFAAGGAPRPVQHVDHLRDSLPHAAHFLGYGLTETNCVGTCNVADNYLAKPRSSGPASFPLAEVAILGPDGLPLPAGLRGEIAVRSVCNIRGYWGNPDETAAAFRDDGFFLTGDIGYLDDDGYLFVVDRKKDIIIRGGENIASAEVELALCAHPGVAEASVFGLPHDRYGEVPVAVYAIRDGHRLSEQELRSHLEARIAAFKVPVRLWRENVALPRLGSEKIDKQGLKARYSQDWEGAKGAL